MQKNYSSRMELPEWIIFFMEFIVSDDLKKEVTESFLRHLVDLGVLLPVDLGLWQWGEARVDSENLLTTVQADLELLSEAEAGFALAYFIGYKDLNKKSLDSLDSKNATQKSNGLSSEDKPASDLSNLQIVKKVGKQLQPFLQLEESIVSRLVGEHVSRQDAQRLFHYMFGKIGTKAEPRTWEQISRKRHR